MESFSAQDGIKVQTEQLAKWSVVLKPKVHKALVKWATKHNENPKVKSGMDIVRGTDLDTFVMNYPNYIPAQQFDEPARRIESIEISVAGGYTLRDIRNEGKRLVRLIGFGKDRSGDIYGHWQFILRRTGKPSGKSTSFYKKL